MINILLATYNGEKFLGEQLDSLFNQTVKEFKIIIRDDGSSDNTIDIIKSYNEKHPGKIKLVNDNLGNLGSSKSFMKLLEYCDSEYIMFCDQDDVWLPDKIELSLNKMKELENKYDKNIPLLVFTDLEVVDQKLNALHKSFWKYQKLIPIISNNWKELLAQNVITGCTMILNKKAKEFCLPFELPMMIHDQWVGVNISKYGKVDYLKEQTIFYRQHGNNVAGAHSFGIVYLKNKVSDIKRIINFQRKASKFFKDVYMIELIILKLNINIKRLLIQ